MIKQMINLQTFHFPQSQLGKDSDSSVAFISALKCMSDRQ